MAGSGRIITATELCDIVKDNTISIHGSWTSLIDPLVTTTDDLEDLIYSRGVYLEDRLASSYDEKKPGPMAFPALPNSSYDGRIQLLTDKVTALTAALHTCRTEDYRQPRGSR